MKRNLKKCVTCKRVEGVPYKPLPTPDLPMERVSLDPPFAHTGLDFLGLLYVRVVCLLIYMCLHKSDPSGANTISECRIFSVSLSEVRKSPRIASHPHVSVFI